jgi:hypothetical protein
MRFELKDEIGYVDTKQEYSSATGDDQKTLLTIVVEIRKQLAAQRGHQAPLDRRNNVLRGMIRSWDHKSYSLD